MSHWLKKSKGNLQVAEATYTNKELCHSSVHCGYYACLQLMKHVLTNVVKPASVLPRDGKVHKVAQDKMFDAIAQELDRNVASDFNNDILSLRIFRHESDYDNIEITLPKAEQAYKLASKIYKLIGSNFSG